MKVDDIEIHSKAPKGSYKIIGSVEAKVHATTAFSREPTLEDVNSKLREEALKMGANAVINVKYKRHFFGLTGYKHLTASGQAVLLRGPNRAETAEEDPLKILKLRLAKGEITKKEFREMKRTLEE